MCKMAPTRLAACCVVVYILYSLACSLLYSSTSLCTVVSVDSVSSTCVSTVNFCGPITCSWLSNFYRVPVLTLGSQYGGISTRISTAAAAAASQHSSTVVRRKFCKSRVCYYHNATATFNISLLSAGDIHPNPGPSSTSKSTKISLHQHTINPVQDINTTCIDKPRIVYSADELKAILYSMKLRCPRFFTKNAIRTYLIEFGLCRRFHRGCRGGRRRLRDAPFWMQDEPGQQQSSSARAAGATPAGQPTRSYGNPIPVIIGYGRVELLTSSRPTAVHSHQTNRTVNDHQSVFPGSAQPSLVRPASSTAAGHGTTRDFQQPARLSSAAPRPRDRCLIQVPVEDCRMPVLLLTNLNRLHNKLDELSVLVKTHQPTVLAITESWLHSNTPDDAVSLQNYNIMRRDRLNMQGGGVLLYIAKSCNARRLLAYESDNFEVLWAALRPKLLPRPLSILLVAVFLLSTVV